MPAFVERLPTETIRMLAVYVHSLGGGVVEPSTAALTLDGDALEPALAR